MGLGKTPRVSTATDPDSPRPARYGLITTFGLGHMRPASGTWGSLPAPAIGGGLWLVGLAPGGTGLVSIGASASAASLAYHGVLGALLVLFSWACIRDGAHAEAKWGHDPGEVVADETAGQCIPLLGLPALAFEGFWHALATLALAFLAFRVMDILKPWPAGRLQDIKGGWGILLDDLMAGVYAAVIVHLAVWLVWPVLPW